MFISIITVNLLITIFLIFTTASPMTPTHLTSNIFYKFFLT